MRLAILKKVQEEEKRIITRDRQAIEKSVENMDHLRRKAQGNTTEELRAWREIRH